MPDVFLPYDSFGHQKRMPMRPPYKPEPADTRPFDEQTRDGW